MNNKLAIAFILLSLGWLVYTSITLFSPSEKVEKFYNKAIKYCNAQEKSEDKTECRRQVNEFYSVRLKEQKNGK